MFDVFTINRLVPGVTSLFQNPDSENNHSEVDNAVDCKANNVLASLQNSEVGDDIVDCIANNVFTNLQDNDNKELAKGLMDTSHEVLNLIFSYTPKPFRYSHPVHSGSTGIIYPRALEVGESALEVFAMAEDRIEMDSRIKRKDKVIEVYLGLKKLLDTDESVDNSVDKSGDADKFLLGHINQGHCLLLDDMPYEVLANFLGRYEEEINTFYIALSGNDISKFLLILQCHNLKSLEAELFSNSYFHDEDSIRQIDDILINHVTQGNLETISVEISSAAHPLSEYAIYMKDGPQDSLKRYGGTYQEYLPNVHTYLQSTILT